MNSFDTFLGHTSGSAFTSTLDRTAIQRQTPAALAVTADPRTSPAYTFLSSERVIQAMALADFYPVSGLQARGRQSQVQSARHAIRFRRHYETVSLRDAIPEILFINSHDGRSSTQFRLALYRPVCTNGLIVCDQTLPVWRVSHRGNVLDAVIAAALAQAAQLEAVGALVERMERKTLAEEQRLAFAADALDLRFPKGRPNSLDPAQVLLPRREQDVGNDLWRTYNVVQEAVIKGGLEYQSATRRAMRSRGIKGIQQDVRLNEALWTQAVSLLD